MTDSSFAQRRNAGQADIPEENTLESLLSALRSGADFIETDAIATADGEIVLAHSNDPSMHIFPPLEGIPGKRYIDEMTLAEVQSLHIGSSGQGRIPTLRELLRAIAAEFQGSGTILNLELKGIQATPRATAPPLSGPVLETIRQEGFPLERVLFSSFSVRTLEELTALEPAARTGLLFYTAPPGSSYADTVLFEDGSEFYIPFHKPNIEAALRRLPKLEALIPEIQDLTPDTVELAARNRLAILTYGYPEESPLKSRTFAEAAKQAVRLCRQHDVKLGLITDFIADMGQLIRQEMPKAPGGPGVQPP